MNIDYSKIIESADVRRQALQAFEAEMSKVLEIEAAAIKVNEYLKTMVALYQKIDREGQALLPDQIRHLMEWNPAYSMNLVVNKEQTGLRNWARAFGLKP